MIRFPRNRHSNVGVARYKEQEETIAQSKLNGGLVTSIDPRNLENNQFQQLENFSVEYDRIKTVPGLTLAGSVTGYVQTIAEHSNSIIFITRTGVSRVGDIGTVENVLAGTALSAGVFDYNNVAVINDRFFFSNYGADEIQEADLIGLTFGDLGNAPKYKFLIALNNRLVGAHLRGASPNPVEIGWSGDLNFGEWNPLVDVSAGSFPLVESPAGVTDEITGIVPFFGGGMLFRERSIYQINTQPSADQPFSFVLLSTDIGCDTPGSIVSTPHGIIWYDERTDALYLLKPNSSPEKISNALDVTLRDAHSIRSRGSYNVETQEYTLYSASNGLDSRNYVFSFKTNAWSYRYLYHASRTISALSGMLALDPSGHKSLLAATDGTYYIRNTTVDTFVGTTMSRRARSKEFSIPRRVGYISKVKIGFIPRLAGSFLFYYSKGSRSSTEYGKTATWVIGDVGKYMTFEFTKHLRCEQFMFDIFSSEGLFDIIDYEISAIVSSAETQAER